MNMIDFLMVNPPDSDDEDGRQTPRFGSMLELEDIEYSPVLLLPEIDVFPHPESHIFPQPGDSLHDRLAALIDLPPQPYTLVWRGTCHFS